MTARIAAGVAGFALVFMSFAPMTNAQTSTADLQAQISALLAQIQSLQAQLGGTTVVAGACSFTRDLTIGVTGADVTCLQNYLISRGFSIPAGATGYFGTQTQGATASWQAANGVSPTAGYFGPISRAKYAMLVSTTVPTNPSNPSTPSTTLNGGEADLSNFDLRAGNDLDEGDNDTEIATAKFDVDGGDVNVQRVQVVFQATDDSSNIDNKPWQYVDSLSVYSNGEKIGEADAGDRDDWDSDDSGGDFNASNEDYYTLTIDTDGVIRDGDNAELSIRADAQSNFDSDSQSFEVTIPDDGIRAVDAAGIQEYTGDDGDHVSLGLGEAENGDLSVRQSDEDPDSSILVADDTDTSDEFTVFAFDLKNQDDADALLDEITIDADVTEGSATGHTNDLTDIVRKATLTIDGDDYDGDINADNITFDDLDTTVDGNDTVTGTLTVELYGQENHYAATGQQLQFSLDGDNVEAEGADTGDDSDVSGAYTGATHTILLSGVDVESDSTSQSVTSTNNNSVGNYSIKFDVTAIEDDAYIPASAAEDSSATAGAIYDIIGDTFSGTQSAVLTSTADKNGSGNFVVREGSTETFTLTVALDPSSTGIFGVELTDIQFGTSSTDTTPDFDFPVDTSNSDFQTDTQTIPG